MLPARIRDKEAEREAWKKPNRTERFKSQKHRDYVRTFACTKCGETAGIEVAHVRIGSDAGMSRKPSDFYTVSLCKPCHTRQHSEGEPTFWKGHNIKAIMDAFCATSPARREIEAAKKERGL